MPSIVMTWTPSWPTSLTIACSTCRAVRGREAIVHYGEDRHWACGGLGVSEWTLTGTSVSGEDVEVRGVDLLEFVDGKVTRKDSFWKMIE
jgi:hypothetical protein